MIEGLDNKYIEDSPEDSPVMNGYLYAQAMLDRFVAINYETAIDAYRSNASGNEIDTAPIRQQMVDIIRNNPPLATLPSYFRDGRANYLWYSDFYDDAGKEVFKAYRQFASTLPKITPTNYKTELDKIDLPYFNELVNLISLEKLYTEAERRLAAAKKKAKPKKTTPKDAVKQVATDTAAEVPQPIPAVEQAVETPKPEPVVEQVAEIPQHEPAIAQAPLPEAPIEQPKSKRSYEPKLNNEQYSILAECIEAIKLFRRPVTATELKSLFAGKLSEPLQATNQKSLTYLLDQLVEAKYIKPTWITIAERNRDFTSFLRGKNAERYGAGPHYITWQQFSNCRSRNNKEYVEGLPTIEEAIEKMQECGK